MSGGGTDGGYGTFTDQMANASTNIQNLRGELDKRNDTLRGDMKAVTTGWKGPAADEGQKMADAIQQVLANLNKALQNIAVALGDQGKEYTDISTKTGQQVADLTSKIQKMMSA
jgi:WXG100 family type VII secretion target